MSGGILIQDEQRDRASKGLLLAVCAAVFFLALLARLIYIQVIMAEENQRLSAGNCMQLHILKAPRGRILDRNGYIMARNRPSYSVCVLPYKLQNRGHVVHNLCSIVLPDGSRLFEDSLELVTDIRNAYRRRFDITRLREDVSAVVVSIIEEHAMDLPGIVVETEARRDYPLGAAAFHVLGYMSDIPEEQFDSLRKKGYTYGDHIGKAGIEQQYEQLFRGRDGREYVEVNAFGKRLGPIQSMPRTEPVWGDDVVTSLDARLQLIAEAAFDDTLKGAVVALDPRTGEVLVMLSHVSADPNIFSLASSARSKNWAAIATDPNLPLNNRAVSGTYAPGSTFKLVTALAGLESGRLHAQTHMPRACSGAYRIGSRIVHCWKLTGHGSFNLVQAVQQSCNIYFYQTGLLLGDVVINRYAALLGLGEKTGIDLPGEKTGWLSGEEAYNRRFSARRGWKWTQGLVCDLAIGQAQILTPIQLALMGGGIGTGHLVYRPRLLMSARRPDNGAVTMERSPEVLRKLEISPENLAVMHEAMVDVIGPGGTAGRAAVPGVNVGGKTGSAQNPQGDKTHALFVACAPIENPTIAISVVVENAGHGGSVAAPIAGRILRYYFKHVAPVKPDTTVDSMLVALERLTTAVPLVKR